MSEKPYTWTVSYLDNRRTHHVVKNLDDHQKEAFLEGLKNVYYTPMGQFGAFQDTIVCEKVVG